METGLIQFNDYFFMYFMIQATNDTRFADVHVEAINEGVKNMIDLQPVYAAKNTEEIEVFLKNTCPLNCTDRGICSDEGKIFSNVGKYNINNN